MVAKAGVYALALGAALIMASGAMLSDEAMAQADDVAVQATETPMETVAVAQADDVAAQNEAEAAVRDEAVDQPVPMRKPAVADRPAKSDLDQSAVRAAPVTRSPRVTRTSARAITLPKIIGSYR